ncbi:ATP-dependent helicase [Fulvimarina endophytica]|uniref:DNA 3'-5' helicase n=1 Tax=Fulvimarina endophytica TaxID=2293836 RepID=A0A371WZ53_9HYPH|nr:ATP-dependent helicase [Fulvimarina endophytica]RFC62261.1 ATP-dependent helicase [Fulvimarina endophytica]
MPIIENAPLDEIQRRFVTANDTDIRLLAPAGSGKTHSLLWRCLHLHRQSRSAARFLLVTFTRAARDELRARLNSGGDFAEIATSADVVTLNGYGWRAVRDTFSSPKLSVSAFERQTLVNGTLASAWNEDERLREAMRAYPFKAPGVLASLLETMKALGFDHETPSSRQANDRIDALEDLGLIGLLEEPKEKLLEFGALANGRWETFLATVVPFFVKACEAQRRAAAFTLEDQKYFGWLALRNLVRDQRLPAPEARLTHILVDEFQDINPLDLELILTIAALNDAKLTIVGDDDQAIFEWRGAAPDFILDPNEQLARPFETHILEMNYRCPRNIVMKSAELIAHNKRREKKKMTPVSEVEAEIKRLHGETFLHTTNAVVNEIRGFVAGGLAGQRMALLSRKRAQLIPYQIMLAREDIPFCAAEDLHLFLSDSFKRLLGALKTRLTAQQLPALAAIGFTPPNLVDEIMVLADSVQRYPMRKAERDALASFVRSARPETYDAAVDRLEVYDGSIRGEKDNGKTVKDFALRLRRFLHAGDVRAAIAALEELYSGFRQDYGRGTEDIFLADPPFFYLSAFAGTYGDDFKTFIADLEKAMSTLVKLPGSDSDDRMDEQWKRPVHLMTALRAKGREFHTIVMLDAVDGIWPLRRAKTERQIEGERRLFYVAMTRAKARLLVTTSGRIGDAPVQPSPFLQEAGLLS